MTEFDDVIRLLRDNRPEATELELDQIKQRIRRSAAQPPRRSQDMKSRLAILLMLVLGMVFSTTGVGLAIQNLTSDASIRQYGEDTPPGEVLGEEDEGNLAGEEDEGNLAGEDVQEPRQVETGAAGELPFSGFLALPVLLGGVALLSAGLVLRRRTHSDRS
jgi:hypothetical protein